MTLQLAGLALTEFQLGLIVGALVAFSSVVAMGLLMLSLLRSGAVDP